MTFPEQIEFQSVSWGGIDHYANALAQCAMVGANVTRFSIHDLPSLFA